MDQSIDWKVSCDLRQMVLVSDEIDGQPVAIPHSALLAYCAVGRASNDVAERDGVADHLHRDRTRRVTVLQRAIDIEADEHAWLLLTRRRVRISWP